MIRVGIVGTNTSHAGVYAGLINGSTSDAAGTSTDRDARVVGVWSSGRTGLSGDHSDDSTLAEQYSIDTVVRHPEELIGQIDLAVILDDYQGGALHAELARPFLEARVATYVDKPMTLTVTDAVELFELGGRTGAPLMSCSALRFADELNALRPDAVGTARLVSASGPGDWFNYGVHTVESLVTVQGIGATSVQQFRSDGRDVTVITGVDGPRAIVATLRDAPASFRLTAHGTEATTTAEVSDYAGFYGNTIDAAITMAATGKSPVDPRETLEVLGILAAGERSAETGATVGLADVLPGVVL